MKTRIQKWGNSMALRIPKPFAEEVGLEPKTIVEIRLNEGSLVITPATSERVTLNELLSEITGNNLHDEYDFGDTVGREAW